MRAVVLRLALVALSLGAVELAFRLAGLGTRTERSALIARVEGWREPGEPDAPEGDGGDAERAAWILDPFLGVTTRRLPWRLAEQAGDFDDATYEILVVGGSVAVGMATMAAEDLAVPVRVEAHLAGRPVRVISLARGAYKQPQQLHLVSQALTHGWSPDAVVNLDGFNELAIGVQNALDLGAHPFWPSFAALGPLMNDVHGDPELRAAALELDRQRERARALGGPLPLGLHRTAFGRALSSGLLRGAVGRFERARDVYLARLAAGDAPAGPPFEPGFERALELAVQNWFESSRSLHALCAARGIAYLHVLQPTLHDEGSKPLTPAEVEAGASGPETWIRAVRAGYPLLREAGARLTELGVPFHDATGVFAGDERELYYDVCHFGGPGQFTLAAEVGAALARSLR